MNKLIKLVGPVASVAAGILLANFIDGLMKKPK